MEKRRGNRVSCTSDFVESFQVFRPMGVVHMTEFQAYFLGDKRGRIGETGRIYSFEIMKSRRRMGGLTDFRYK